MIKKTKVDLDTLEKIMNNLQIKHKVTDMEATMVYYKYTQKMTIDEFMPLVYKQFYPNKKKPKRSTMSGVYSQHMKKPNVKAYIQDLGQAIKEEYEKRNAILTIGERMAFLSGIIRGTVKETSYKNGMVGQKEASLKMKMDAINILNDFDLKSKEMQNQSEFIIDIVGEPIAINAEKSMNGVINNINRNTQADSKIKVEPQIEDQIKDVM